MKVESKDTLTISITGVLTIGRDDLEQVLVRCLQPSPTNTTPGPRLSVGELRPARMSFTVKQTAELLGVGDATVYRLLKRGLLRSSSALRTKVIPKSEIERFLNETTKSSR